MPGTEITIYEWANPNIHILKKKLYVWYFFYHYAFTFPHTIELGSKCSAAKICPCTTFSTYVKSTTFSPVLKGNRQKYDFKVLKVLYNYVMSNLGICSMSRQMVPLSNLQIAQEQSTEISEQSADCSLRNLQIFKLHNLQSA